MIQIELQLRGEPCATLRVEDGQSSMSGRTDLFDTRVPVIDRRTGHQVRFDEDPEVWARNLDSSYRAGHLVAVIVEDTDPNPPPERPARAQVVIPDVAAEGR